MGSEFDRLCSDKYLAAQHQEKTMNELKKSIAVETKISVFIRDWLTMKPNESIQSPELERENELDKVEESNHPVWNGELDDPIWW
jgi:hypothetical protein